MHDSSRKDFGEVDGPISYCRVTQQVPIGQTRREMPYVEGLSTLQASAMTCRGLGKGNGDPGTFTTFRDSPQRLLFE